MIQDKRIDFKQLAKPVNLQNSAVLRMLEEEEERKRAGKSGLKRVAWPPPPEDQDIDSYIQGPVEVKTRGVGEYRSESPSVPRGESPLPTVGGKNQPQHHHSEQQQRQQTSIGLRQPSQFQAAHTSPKIWAPVVPPAALATPIQPQTIAAPSFPSWNEEQLEEQQQCQQAPLTPSTESWKDNRPQTPQPFSSWNDQPQPELTTVTTQDHQSSQPQQQPQSTAASHFEPPPAIITLRPELPISQKPAPVFPAQPAATNPNSGSMRGDLKWPPQSVREQTEAENRARIELAKGPVFRPRRVQKDYTSFFSQNALTNTYPGYRAPPGTQYFTPAYQQ